MKMRRSVRSFSSKPISLKIVQNLIKVAGCSPSAGNAQPWRFCIVVDDNRKAEIRALIEADEKNNIVQRKGEGSEWVMDVSQLQQTWSRPYLTDAPLLLIVCHEFVGLSTVVTSPLNAGPRISRLLRRPDNECVFLLLPLGYAAADALVPDLKRKSVENIASIY
ncbi:nitroreductase family protein [Oesophagostomum dentatum]|uniref:Nitroreductase family protein n=1 Tax=Oesophagostomum dentatum TaxID=61180 RepID=A0A0B1THD2_OESDE|nr:nitroreductase family protein [Oesophagostomum dentatum]